MARKDNRIETKTTKLTLPWPLFEYMDRAIATGFYGATYTAAAEKMIEKHIEWLIEHKKIKELTPEELANSPKTGG
jgi:hypothetical protein